MRRHTPHGMTLAPKQRQTAQPVAFGSSGSNADQFVRFGQISDTQYTFQDIDWQDAQADVLIIPVFQSKGSVPISGQMRALSDSMDGRIGIKINDTLGRFTGKKGDLLFVDARPADGVKIDRVILAGLGDVGDFNLQGFEQTLTDALTQIPNAQNLALVLPAEPNHSRLTSLKMLPPIMSAVANLTYQSETAIKPRQRNIQNVVLINNKHGNKTLKELHSVYPEKLKRSLQLGKALVDAKDLARDIINRPANQFSAKDFEQRAYELSRQYPDLTWEKPKLQKWIKTNMPAFHAVSLGTDAISANETPRLVKLKYTPPAGDIKQRVALIGKSVTNSDPADRSGGAYLLGVMKALGELKPQQVEVTAYLPVAGHQTALSHGVVQTAGNKQVLMKTPDREGHLALVDTLHHALQDKPDQVMVVTNNRDNQSFGDYAVIAARQDSQEKKLGPNSAYRIRLSKQAELLREKMDTLPVRPSDLAQVTSLADNSDLVLPNPTSNRRHTVESAAFILQNLPAGSTTPVAYIDLAGAVFDSSSNNASPATAVGMETIIRDLLKTKRRLVSGHNTW